MKKIILPLIFFISLNLQALAMQKNHKHSKDYKLENLEIERLYIYNTPKGAKTAAGFMKIENEGNMDDQLISVTNVTFADKTELHEMKMDNKIMKMRPIKSLTIKNNSEVYLKSSGYHIMFIGLKKQIIEGKHYKATLNFKNSGSIDVMFIAVNRGYHPDDNHHKHH
jgi:periplasmic copper chaperone A